jgi:rod shape-determining protein MreD
MRYGFYIGICLLLILVQTAILPYLNIFHGVYDLLIPFVIFISICLPVRESVPFVLILGLIIDNLSGSPFGLYLTFYFWLFVGVRWIIKYLQVSNKLLLSLVIVVAVLIENILVISTFMVLGTAGQLQAETLENISRQLLWALVTGPPLLLCFLTISKRLGDPLNGAPSQLSTYG